MSLTAWVRVSIEPEYFKFYSGHGISALLMADGSWAFLPRGFLHHMTHMAGLHSSYFAKQASKTNKKCLHF